MRRDQHGSKEHAAAAASPASEHRAAKPQAAALQPAAAAPPSGLGGALRELRVSADPLRLALTRSSLEAKLFGSAEPAKVGRFVLLGQAGEGGMGAVYAAYDPQLDRRVALKVLHADAPTGPTGQARLLAEARALARVDHPNVVPVHDALQIGDDVVVVMEWVEGDTLAAWERARPRTWREVLWVYLAAGRGLAAAHALGIVHRDFKPHNVILGKDGRPRVLDFGLARIAPVDGQGRGRADAEDDLAPASADQASASADQASALVDLAPGERASAAAQARDAWPAALTAAGARVGTLAYMAPEQLAGAEAGPAADQFAFCVALYRALYGVAPYAGASVDELALNIRAAALREPPRGVGAPRWLRAALRRGLAADPARRHASMSALLAELDRKSARRRWGARAALFVAALAVAGSWWTRASSEEACSQRAAETALAWSASASAEAERALALVAAPAAVRAGVARDLATYRDAWVAQHRAACQDHQRGAQSAALLDRRMLCLRRRRQEVEAALSALGGVAAERAARAREVTARLPSVADCADLEALLAELEPPAAPAQRRAVAAVQRELATAAALDYSGRTEQALLLIRALAPAARAAGYAPLLVEHSLAEAKLLLARGDYGAAARALTATEGQALAVGALRPGVEAAARRIYAQAMRGEDLPGLLRQGEIVEPLSRGLRGDTFARPLLLNNLGVVHMAMGRRDLAAASFAKARVALDGLAQPALELTSIDANLAMVTSDDSRREAAAGRVWQARRAQLGDEHPSTIDALLALGKFTHDVLRAYPLVARACGGYAEHHPSALKTRLHCLLQQGLLESELGLHATAAATYQRAADLWTAAPRDDLRTQYALAAGFAALERQDPAAAIAALAAVAEPSPSAPWWSRASAAAAQLGRLCARGEPAAALRTRADSGRARPAGAPAPRDAPATATLEHTVAVFEEATKVTEDFEPRIYLARARAALAQRAAPRRAGAHCASCWCSAGYVTQ